jgi:hypothetical protein
MTRPTPSAGRRTARRRIRQVTLVLLACAGSAAVAQPHVDLTARPRKAPSATAASIGDHLRVPDVIGLNLLTAQDRLAAAGYTMKLRGLDRPDPATPLGQVVAQTPKAGTVQAGGDVEVRTPQAAIRTGSGGVARDLTQEGTGYDLDNGRYEALTRGADVVLRTHAGRPPGASSATDGDGDFLEPNGGAILVRAPLLSPKEFIGEYPTYVACGKLLRDRQSGDPPNPVIQLNGVTNKKSIVVCILTSEHQMAAIEVVGQEGAPNDLQYYFSYALFRYPLPDVHRPAVDLSPRH